MSTAAIESTSFTVAQVAALANCSTKLIYKLIRNNNFPAKYFRLGITIRIDRASWERFTATGQPEQGEIAPPRRGPKRKELHHLDLSQFQTPLEIRA